MTNKKKYSLIALLVIVLIGGAFFTYDVFALEKEKKHAEEIFVQGKEDSLEVQKEINEKIISDWENRIYPGVTIEKIDFSGDTKEEALLKLDSEVKTMLEDNSIILNAADKEFKLDYKNLELTLDSEKIIDEALKIGKNLEFDEKIKRIYTKEEEEILATYSFNEEKLDGFIKEVESTINQNEKDATIKVSGGSFLVTPEKEGHVLDSEKAKSQIKEIVLNKDKKNEKVKGEIVVSKPKVKADDLKKVNGVLSTYKTSYGGSTSGRVNNIGVAANKISQSVIMPGEVFSYNKALGSISQGNGFQNAGIIKGNKIEDGIGGGICQVSSTLYQAAVNSGVGIKERRNHSMKVYYLDAGLDAVVYGPSLDLKLVNNYSSPIVIDSYSSNGVVNVTIYGNKSDLGGKSYRVYSKVNQVNNPKTIRRANSSMYAGKEELVQRPITGYVSTTYRDTIKDGKVINTEVLSKDTYKKVDGIVEYGTKKKAASKPAAKPVSKPAPKPKPEEKPEVPENKPEA